MNLVTQVHSGLVGLRMWVERYLHAKLEEVSKESEEFVRKNGYRWNIVERERMEDLHRQYQELQFLLALVARVFPRPSTHG